MARRSFRDPVTNVLKAHGYVEANEPGDIWQNESESFALDPGLWRWGGSAWVAVPQVDAEGFELALHNAFPDQQYVTFLAAFPASWVVVDSIRRGSWAQLQGLIQLALQQGAVTQQQYDAVKAAAIAHAIPVTL